MAKDASFSMLIDMCNQVGWDQGIASLESITTANENAYAHLIAGDYNEQKIAKKLNQTITLQRMTIARLIEYRRQNSL